jgi:hypothetical protein
MYRSWIVVPIMLIIAVSAHPRLARDNHACAEVKEEIREIESRMRAGYTRAQGEKYEAKLRKLKRQRSKLCR